MPWYIVDRTLDADLINSLKGQAIMYDREVINQPRRVDGFSFPEEYKDSVRRLFRVPAHAREVTTDTESPGIVLLEWDYTAEPGVTRPQGAVRPLAVTPEPQVAYPGSNQGIRGILEKYAQENSVRIQWLVTSDNQFRVTTAAQRVSVPVNENGRVTIHMYATPSRSTGYGQPLTSVYDARLDSTTEVAAVVRANPLLPTAEGITITDPAGTPVAQVLQGNIYILLNLDYTSSPANTFDRNRTRGWAAAPRILETILLEAFPLALNYNPERIQQIQQARIDRERQAAQAVLDQTKLAYIQECNRRNTDLLTQVQRAVAEDQQAASRLQTELVAASRRLVENQTRLNQINQGVNTETEKYATEFTKLMELPHVVRIEVERFVIKIFTDTMYITYRNRRYRMGEFRIEINNGEQRAAEPLNMLKIFRVGGIRGPNGTPSNNHPHILPTGFCCLGNIQMAVVQYLRDYEYAMLTELLIDYLQTFNNDSRYEAIEAWPTA